MTDRTKNPGARAGASGAGKPVQSNTEGKGSVACRKRAVTFAVTPHDPNTVPVTIGVAGRVLWALERLVGAGRRGLHPDNRTCAQMGRLCPHATRLGRAD